MKTKVFVYGSLLSGLSNHRLLNGSRLIGAGRAAGGFRMVSFGGYPGVYGWDDGTDLPGELYEVTAETLQRLDRLESNGSFYQRAERTVMIGGEEHTAWVYLLMHPDRYGDLQIVDGNDWRAEQGSWVSGGAR